MRKKGLNETTQGACGQRREETTAPWRVLLPMAVTGSSRSDGFLRFELCGLSVTWNGNKNCPAAGRALPPDVPASVLGAEESSWRQRAGTGAPGGRWSLQVLERPAGWVGAPPS